MAENPGRYIQIGPDSASLQLSSAQENGEDGHVLLIHLESVASVAEKLKTERFNVADVAQATANYLYALSNAALKFANAMEALAANPVSSIPDDGE